MTSKRPTRLDYCQYLLVSQINYTITNYADHTQEQLSHDAINRYLRDDRLTSRLVWENVRSQIAPSAHGYLVLTIPFWTRIFPTRSNWSGCNSAAMRMG